MFLLKCITSTKIYILNKVNNYYIYNRENTIESGFISLEISSRNIRIASIIRNEISIDVNICKKLGITYNDYKFYFMNLFIVDRKHISYISYDRRLLFQFMKNQSQMYYYLTDFSNTRVCNLMYTIFDNIIIYNVQDNYDISHLKLVSNNNIMIYEDAKNILKSSRRPHIYSDIYKNNINHVILLHCNKQILELFKTIRKNTKITYYPYPVNVRYGDTNGLDKNKKYDILYFGNASSDVYPLRNRVYKLLQSTKLTKYNIKIIEFGGYKFDKSKPFIIGDELINLIKDTKYVICTASKYNVLLRKYIEVNYSGTMIIGDNSLNIVNPASIIHIDNTMSDDTILYKMSNAVDNYDVLYNIKPIADGMLTYDNFYNDLITGRFVWKYNSLIG